MRPQDPIPVLIWTLSFTFLIFMRHKAFWDVDEAEYLVNIYNGDRSSLFFGRAGYVYFYHWIWDLCRFLGMSDFHSSFRTVISTINSGFSAVAVTSFYWILKWLGTRSAFAVTAALGTVSHFAFIDTGTSGHGDMMMLGLISLSVVLFVRAHQNEKRSLIPSALLFGWALAVREPTIFFLPAYLIAAWTSANRRPWYAYALAASLSFLIFAAPVLWIFWHDPIRYAYQIVRFHVYNNFQTTIPLFERLAKVLEFHFLRPGWLALLLLPGFFVAHFRSSWVGLRPVQSATLAILLLLPGFLTIVITNDHILTYGRYFIPESALWAFYLSCTVYVVASWMKWPRLAVVLILPLLFMHWRDKKVEWQQVDQTVATLETDFEFLRRQDSQKMVLISATANYYRYRMRTGGKRIQVIGSGWSWPGSELPVRVKRLLHEGREVYLQTSGPWPPDEERDAKKLLSLYPSNPVGGSIVQILLPD